MRRAFPISSVIRAAAFVAAGALAARCPAQESTPAPNPASNSAPSGAKFASVTAESQQKLEESLKELDALRARIADEKLPLSKQLSGLESSLLDARQEYQSVSRLLDTRNLDLTKLVSDIKDREAEVSYLTNLLGEYMRNFEAGLHIAELQEFQTPLDTAKLAIENNTIGAEAILNAEAKLLDVSLARLEGALGGSRFEGEAVDESSGLVKQGTFVIVGPSALFRSADGQTVGTAEQRLNSVQPAVLAFKTPEDAQVAGQFVATSNGQFLFDPTLGNAHKVEATEESTWEHIQKGGPVMLPIFVLAGAALLVVLFKWVALMLVRTPSAKRLRALLNAVSSGDRDAAVRLAKAMPGPTGRMLAIGADHLGEPRELVEEVMYEKVLSTRLKLNRFLPFVAICASAAPLLGLLGTVTGIMKTFSLITVFGTGDVKTLSSGISEALITTEYGLIVAIPSLLLYALLSRRAKALIDRMETAAVAFLNQISKSPHGQLAEAA